MLVCFSWEFEWVGWDVDGEGVGELAFSFLSVVGVGWGFCGCSGYAA